MSPIAAATDRELAHSWDAVLGRLEVELNRHNFTTWFTGSRPLRLEGSTLVVRAHSEMARNWLNEKMTVMVNRALEQRFGTGVTVRFVGPNEDSEPETLPEEADNDEPPRRGYVVGEVNCKYTFETYQQAEGNRLAYQACRGLVGDYDLRFSPVVIFGSPGMGKTHLLHALACTAVAQGKVVACLTAEEFANKYLCAIRDKRMPEFQAEMRRVELLVIDDLQQIVTKPGTQQELVHTMDAVTNLGGAVVVASERDPLELELVERLASRLSMGITARVQPFGHGERREFVERTAQRHRQSLPAWAVDRLAACGAPSVRVLMGAVNAVLALHKNQMLDVSQLDAALARVALADANREATGERELLERIARHFAVKLEDVLAKGGRDPAVKEARAVAVAALHRRGRSLENIGLEFGGRDKGTLSPIAKQGRAMLEADERLRALVG